MVVKETFNLRVAVRFCMEAQGIGLVAELVKHQPFKLCDYGFESHRGHNIFKMFEICLLRIMANYETLVKFKYLFDSDRRLKKNVQNKNFGTVFD